MAASDLIVLATLVLMVAALVIDRLGAAVAVPGPAPVAPLPVPAPLEALPVPDLAGLSALAEGWALLHPAGTVVATNLPERAALLAGACAMLRLASGEAPGQALPWRTVMLQGPSGMLLGEASPRGAVLAVLARRGTDEGALRRVMGLALGEVERRWSLGSGPALAAWAELDAQAADPAGPSRDGVPAGPEPAPAADPNPAAFTPLD